jgi:hypothetical protein
MSFDDTGKQLPVASCRVSVVGKQETRANADPAKRDHTEDKINRGLCGLWKSILSRGTGTMTGTALECLPRVGTLCRIPSRKAPREWRVAGRRYLRNLNVFRTLRGVERGLQGYLPCGILNDCPGKRGELCLIGARARKGSALA